MNGAERLNLDMLPEVAVKPEFTQRQPERHHLFGRAVLRTTGMLLASAAVLGLYEYQADVTEVKQQLTNTHPYIIENSGVPSSNPLPSPIHRNVYESLQGEDRLYADNLRQVTRMAVVNMPGFNLVETYQANKVLSSFDSIGANWSVHYDNKGIDTHIIAQEIVDKAHHDNISDVGLYADSMGTIIESRVAVEIERIAPDINIPFIVMDSPAVGLQVLRPKSKSDGYALLDGIKLPGAEYSRYARLGAEMYLRIDKIHDIDSLIREFNEVHDQVFGNHDLPANSLLAEQFQMIVNSNVEANLAELGRLKPSDRPIIIFMGAAHASADDVVNTPESLKLVQKWTKQAGLTLIGPYGIENFYHGAQYRSKQEYRRIFGQEIIPGIISSLSEGQLESRG